MTEVKTGKLSDIKPTRNNSNKHTARGMKALENALSEDGYVAPMTATADGEIIDGDARLHVAIEPNCVARSGAGYDSQPVNTVEGLS